jgi:ADP-ribose pyrophosphatase
MSHDEHHTVWEGKYLRVRIRGHWEYVERSNSPAGIVIVALTPEGKLLLTEQYRVPVQKNTIELPAGLAGDDNYGGEPFVEAARRELLEETGYAAGEWEELAWGPPSPGLSNEIVVFYRARNLRKAGSGGGAGAEQIRVHEIPPSEAPAWLEEQARRGALIDPKVFAGLYFLSLKSG